jgi:hypothetical protein
MQRESRFARAGAFLRAVVTRPRRTRLLHPAAPLA